MLWLHREGNTTLSANCLGNTVVSCAGILPVAIQLYLVFTYITNASIFVAELKKVRQIIMVLELLVVVVVVVVYMCSW